MYVSFTCVRIRYPVVQWNSMIIKTIVLETLSSIPDIKIGTNSIGKLRERRGMEWGSEAKTINSENWLSISYLTIAQTDTPIWSDVEIKSSSAIHQFHKRCNFLIAGFFRGIPARPLSVREMFYSLAYTNCERPARHSVGARQPHKIGRSRTAAE